MMKKQFVLLAEELRDIPRKNKMYHRTNASYLLRILETGVLKSGQYYSGRLKNEHAICTGRKATMTKLNKQKDFNLSCSVGKVEFIIFKDRIGASKETRGLKKKAISEFGVAARDDIKAIFKETYGDDYKKKYIEFRQAVKPFFMDWDNLRDLTDSHVISHMSKKFPEIDNMEYVLNKLEETRIYTASEREGEERIVGKERFSIPVNKNIMMIKLIDGFIEEALNRKLNFNKQLRKQIIKNKDLFVKNKEFKKFIKLNLEEE